MKDNHKKEKKSQVTRLLHLIIIFMSILIIGGWLLIYDSCTNGNSEDNNQTKVAADNENNFSKNQQDNEENDTSKIKIAEETSTPIVEATAIPKNTTTPKPPKTALPHKNIKIAIDAGHQAQGDSGTEPDGPGSVNYKAKVSGGATGISSSVPEYQLNLNVAKKLRKKLSYRGYDVYMIRTSNDVNISNDAIS